MILTIDKFREFKVIEPGVFSIRCRLFKHDGTFVSRTDPKRTLFLCPRCGLVKEILTSVIWNK